MEPSSAARATTTHGQRRCSSVESAPVSSSRRPNTTANATTAAPMPTPQCRTWPAHRRRRRAFGGRAPCSPEALLIGTGSSLHGAPRSGQPIITQPAPRTRPSTWVSSPTSHRQAGRFLRSPALPGPGRGGEPCCALEQPGGAADHVGQQVVDAHDTVDGGGALPGDQDAVLHLPVTLGGHQALLLPGAQLFLPALARPDVVEQSACTGVGQPAPRPGEARAEDVTPL